MRVRVDGIPKPGLRIDLDLAVDWTRDAAADALEAAADSLSGFLDVQRASGRTVRVLAEVQTKAPATCDRCSEAALRTVQTEVELRYLPHSDEAEAELELGADDLDIGWYHGGALDLGTVLREVIALAISARTLCSDTAGCDTRTAALLEQGSATETGHPAFAALSELH